MLWQEREEASGRSGVGVTRWHSNAEIGGSTPASALSFLHVDVGDALKA